jgi:hypothetical protein
MKYARAWKGWTVELEGKSYIIESGTYFNLYFAEKNLYCRLKRDLNWYVIIYGVRFYLRPME